MQNVIEKKCLAVVIINKLGFYNIRVNINLRNFFGFKLYFKKFSNKLVSQWHCKF